MADGEGAEGLAVTDPNGAAAHDETECVPSRHALASSPGPGWPRPWPRLAVGARQWHILRRAHRNVPDSRVEFISIIHVVCTSPIGLTAYNEQSKTMGMRPGGPMTVLPRRRVASIARYQTYLV